MPYCCHPCVLIFNEYNTKENNNVKQINNSPFFAAGWSDNSTSKPEDSEKPQAKSEVKEEATADAAKDAEKSSSPEATSSEAPEKKDSE